MKPVDPIIKDPEQPVELPPAVSTAGYVAKRTMPAWLQTALSVAGFVFIAAVIWFVARR